MPETYTIDQLKEGGIVVIEGTIERGSAGIVMVRVGLALIAITSDTCSAIKSYTPPPAPPARPGDEVLYMNRIHTVLAAFQGDLWLVPFPRSVTDTPRTVGIHAVKFPNGDPIGPTP